MDARRLRQQLAIERRARIDADRRARLATRRADRAERDAAAARQETEESLRRILELEAMESRAVDDLKRALQDRENMAAGTWTVAHMADEALRNAAAVLVRSGRCGDSRRVQDLQRAYANALHSLPRVGSESAVGLDKPKPAALGEAIAADGGKHARGDQRNRLAEDGLWVAGVNVWPHIRGRLLRVHLATALLNEGL